MSHLRSHLRTGALGAALALVATFTGCGGGGPRFVGTLEVENDLSSGFDIDRIDTDELNGPDHFSFDVFVTPGNFFDVDLYPDTYDVTVFWNDGSVETHRVDVFHDTTTSLTVSN